MTDAPVDPEVVAARIADIRRQIGAHATRDVTVVAVTKRFGPEAVLAALDAGVADIGENYAQELVAKHEGVQQLRPGADVRWHFIGHIQRNKVKLVGSLVTLWQTVDSLRLGNEIAKRVPGARVLVQVNLAGTESQGGVDADAVPDLVADLRRLELDVAGLMMIGRAGDPVGTRALFSDLRTLADDLELPEVSMGMTDDLPLALEAGATIVRLGTAIFGPRP